LARVKKHELAFYDGVAQRIRGQLGRQDSELTTTSLATGIGWNRTSLSRFLNRRDRTIPTHFLPQIAEALNVSIEYLLEGDVSRGGKRTKSRRLRPQ
jgi:transcriptional regulator with XRE-family HTH domain